MKTAWKHDDTEWDPFTVLGEVELVDSVGGAVRDQCVMLDAWLVALAEGLLAIREGRAESIDLIDEPEPLEFLIQDNIRMLQWQEQRVIIEDLSASCDDLAGKMRELAFDLASRPEPRDESAITELESYAVRLTD